MPPRTLLNLLGDHVSNRPVWAFCCLFLATGVFFATSCGKRKPPLPPLPKVSQRAEIAGFQRGDKVILSWKLPDKNAPAGDVQYIKRVDVYRLAERLTSPLSLSEEQFAARSTLVASVAIKDEDFGAKPFSYTDTLQIAGQPSRLRYAVRYVNGSGQKAPFSNFLVIEPAGKVAAAPPSLTAKVTQDAVELRWETPPRNADGTTPVNLEGFNIYRSSSAKTAGQLINKSPVSDPEYDDRSFEFGKDYFYFVRAVSAGPSGTRIEGAESDIVTVTPKDTFPPTAPASITIGAAPGAISLFFPPNPESDIAGYKIFRTEDDSVPKAEWKLITSKLLETNTFQDTAVEAGKTYFYYVVAVDKFGNESPQSEVVGDRVP